VRANAEIPPPILAVDADDPVRETTDGFVSIGGAVAAFAHDPERDWLLLGGADGRVRFLDLAAGRIGTLLEPPGLRPIQQLALSRDRTVLGAACGTDMIEDGSARPMRCSAAVQFWVIERAAIALVRRPMPRPQTRRRLGELFGAGDNGATMG